MDKNILIIGAARSGKTTLTWKFVEEQGTFIGRTPWGLSK